MQIRARTCSLLPAMTGNCFISFLFLFILQSVLRYFSVVVMEPSEEDEGTAYLPFRMKDVIVT